MGMNKNREATNMKNLFENGRMLKLTPYGTEDGLKMCHADENEKFAC